MAALDADVAICGFGPVGQLLALLLGDLGVHVLALEREPSAYQLPRAAVIDDEVLRVLQSVRLDGAVLADATVHPRASIVTAGGRVVEVLRAESGQLGHPPLVSINQPALERTLTGALASRPTVTVRRGTRVTGVRPGADCVSVELEGGERVRASWVVACDGAASPVRSALGIPFRGRTAPQRWIVLDARVDAPLRRVPHPLFVGRPERPLVTLPMSPGRHRWEFMLHPGEDPAPLLAPAALRSAIAEWLDGEPAEAERAVVYTFHTRVAARWRQGRVLLAGDAAHVMPPFAGQGLGSGARDAGNLGWKLAAVLDGAPDALLDTYERERRPHVRATQRTARLMGALVQATDPRVAAARDTVLDALDGTAAQRWLTSNVKPLPTYGDGAFVRRPARLPPRRTVGAMFPQSDRLDDRLGRGWAVVIARPDGEGGDGGAAAFVGAGGGGDGGAGAFTRAGLPVHDAGSDAARLRRHGLVWALLRPDRYVFACGCPGDDEAVASALSAWRQWCGHVSTRGPAG